jgi:hypothetical protein
MRDFEFIQINSTIHCYQLMVVTYFDFLPPEKLMYFHYN